MLGPARTIAPWLLAVAGAAAPGPSAADVVFEPLPPSTRWREAVEPGALRLACATGDGELEAIFEREGLPFRREMLRRSEAVPSGTS